MEKKSIIVTQLYNIIYENIEWKIMLLLDSSNYIIEVKHK